ncbi:trypsin-like serine peptidase [Paenibacillus senegalimassiliensis]|uniref:trypsin-like serine peptidase n=1 Tax=Paenibacillus senegalimassiliensis TaxID=1737426 RepID=UPI00073E14C6|nr:serine protease [Paenibacillus senegalimassiliensis]
MTTLTLSKNVIKKLKKTEWKGFADKPKQIIGQNNLLNISWMGRGLEISKSVARIITPEGYGTGFLIGPDILLTNNHVIKSAKDAEKSVVEFNYQDDWENNIEKSQRFNLDSTQFITNIEHDYTIVKVKEAPGNIFGFVNIQTIGSRPSPNNNVVIIQHPSGGKKQICLNDNYVQNTFENKVQYTTDTEPGSSGSPVFDSNWRLVALHHASNIIQKPDGTYDFCNEGILINHVLLDAQAFLGLTDPLIDITLNELKPDIERLIFSNSSISSLSNEASEFNKKYPRFEPLLNDWINLHQTSEFFDPLTVAAIAGVASGAGIAHLAHVTSKKEVSIGISVSANTVISDLIRSVKENSEMPSQLIRNLINHLFEKPDIAKEAYQHIKNTNEILPLGYAVYLAGVAAGASAYAAGK